MGTEADVQKRIEHLHEILARQQARIDEFERGRRRRFPGRRILVGLSVLVVLSLATNTFASIPDSNGLVTVCYSSASTGGTLRIIDTATTKCRPTEKQVVLYSAGAPISASTITGVLPVSAGGTGSATQNFVDLSSAQTIGGAKTFSSGLIANGSISSTTGGFAFPDGSTQTTAAENQGMDAFSSSGTWTAPPGVTQVLVQAWGGGGGGAAGCADDATSTYAGGGGGGAGAYVERVLPVTPGQTYNVTVADYVYGGQYNQDQPSDGDNGGPTTLDAGGPPLVYAGGGAGGKAAHSGCTTTPSGGAGGIFGKPDALLAAVPGGAGSDGKMVESGFDDGAGGTQGATFGIATGGAGGIFFTSGNDGYRGELIISW